MVRDALSLAFTPRARACYLNRSARTAADRDLSGRVRLALDLVRGEVGAARIEASTLAHPVIENCLREAAFALDVPRAYRNDDPVTAVLNLVFRPRTSERKTGIENPSLNKEIDLIVEAALKDSSANPIAPAALPVSQRYRAVPSAERGLGTVPCPRRARPSGCRGDPNDQGAIVRGVAPHPSGRPPRHNRHRAIRDSPESR